MGAPPLPKLPLGSKVGMLTVIGPKKNRCFPVRCDCGTEKTVYDSNLRYGRTKSCGCNQGAKPWTAARCRIKEGDVFGFLTVVGFETSNMVATQCTCGNRRSFTAALLTGGDYKSCGCKQKRYALGEIVHGRKVVKLGSKKAACLTVECLSCGAHAKINPSLRASKCRNCQNWDSRLGEIGSIYALVCPYTGAVRYVGATKGESFQRAIGHFRERNAKDNRAKALYQWIRELAKDGAMPGCIRLEQVIDGTVHEREIFWIKKMMADGAQLFNSEHSEDKEVTWER